MDNQQAQEILRTYRPGTDDANEAQVAEALRCAERDAELGRWFRNQCEIHAAIRRKLREIPVPENLKEEILRRHEVVRHNKIIELRRSILPLAAAAVVVISLVLGVFYAQTHRLNFDEFRDRLVRQSQRTTYGMMASTNLNDIHTGLLAYNCPDYQLPKTLTKLHADGYAPLEWRNRRVSMVCLKTAKNKELYLLVMDATAMHHAPAAGQTEYARVLHYNSASWTSGGKVYILAGPQDDSELKQYLD